jgi:microcompartment protein CcmL/EutN
MPDVMDAIGLLELSSIAIAYGVEDTMLKTADVELLLARTICSGKYIVMVGGDVAAVTASVEAGKAVSAEALIEDLVISRVDKRIFPAISGAVALEEEDKDALGVVEAFSIAAILEGADAAIKAASVKLFRIHVAMAIGGKGYLMLTGSVADVEAAVGAATVEVARRGMLVSRIVIPRPHDRLFAEMI